MSYIITNISTDAVPASYQYTPDGYSVGLVPVGGGSTTGIALCISDIPGVGQITLWPGNSIDLDVIASRTQILQSNQIRIRVAQGRLSVTATASTDPTTLV